MLTKVCPAFVKAAGPADGLEEGQYEAIVSVFGNTDWYGDRVAPGAFAEDLAAWTALGDPLPVVWSHQYGDPFSHIGVTLDAAELPPGDKRLPPKLAALGGLWTRNQLDLDAEAHTARQVYRLLKGRRVTQFSFSYDVLDASWAVEDGEEFYELRKLRVYEHGPTLIGANQATDLLDIKALERTVRARAGRAGMHGPHTDLDAALAKVRAGIDEATALIRRAAHPDGKATATTPAKTEEPPGAKVDEPTGAAPARVRLLADLDLLDVG